MGNLINKILQNEKPVGISIDKARCDNCNQCIGACPIVRSGCLESLEDKYTRYLCIECYACKSICPKNAITIGDIASQTRVSEIPSGEEMLNLIKSRRSVRSYKTTPIKNEDIDKIIESVKFTPTGHNTQYIDLMFIQSPEILKKLSEIGLKLYKMMSDRIFRFPFSLIYKNVLGEHTISIFKQIALFYENQKKSYEKDLDPILFNAPCIILFLGPGKEFMSKNDADLATQSVSLFAPTVGLGTCMSGIVSSAFSGLYPGIKKIVKIPDGMKVYNALILGYPKYEYSFIPSRKERKVYYV